MKLEDVLSEIKLELTGYVLDMELNDETLVSVVKKALRELERFFDESTMITVPFASCIDLDGEFFREKVSSIVNVYRTEGVGDADGNLNVMNDPIQMAQFALFSNGGTMYNLNDYVLNYASWMTMYKIKNTMYITLEGYSDHFDEPKKCCRIFLNGSSILGKFDSGAD